MFLVLNSELFGMVSDPQSAVPGPWTQAGQLAFIERTLAEHPDPRWTIVIIHQPLWDYGEVRGDWPQVEEMLGERDYTVFAGHFHRYVKHVRNDRKYITLATTGGISNLRGSVYGEFDHIAWVTMTDNGPRIANLLLDGIHDENVVTAASRAVVQRRAAPPGPGPLPPARSCGTMAQVERGAKDERETHRPRFGNRHRGLDSLGGGACGRGGNGFSGLYGGTHACQVAAGRDLRRPRPVAGVGVATAAHRTQVGQVPGRGYLIMIVVTSETITGKRIVRTLGLVRGNTVRARHIGRDIMAGLRNIVGGEIHEYAKLIAESREQSLDRLIAEAAKLGANAVVATRFTTSMMMGGAAELLAVGTAVIVEDEA